MLNLGYNSVRQSVDSGRFQSLERVENRQHGSWLIRILIGGLILTFILLFLPWTQNIRATGNLTALKPGQRPQTVQSVIPGRIEKWWVNEGDYVSAGDTILQLTEIKPEYMDPELLERTQLRVGNKEQSVAAYDSKLTALSQQREAIIAMRSLKLKQADNKIIQAGLKLQSDSMDWMAATLAEEVAMKQYERAKALYEEGIKSLTETENKQRYWQQAVSAKIAAENRWISSKNERINAQMERLALESEFADKLAKIQSEIMSARSAQLETEGEMHRLRTTFRNVERRSQLYYVRAPQDGYIAKSSRTGIGETVSEGTPLMEIVPAGNQLAVEMYVHPMDLPLINPDQPVRLQFDGWPAIVFSGWPQNSYGTYGGRVVAMDRVISNNGRYRVLIAPDKTQHPWPEELRIGSGALCMALLNDVPIWYEIWRKLNGFPPDFYGQQEQKHGPKK